MEEKTVKIIKDDHYYTIIFYTNGVPTYTNTDAYWNLSYKDKELVDTIFEEK